MVLVLPSLLLVFGAGFLIGGVRLPLTVWLASLALMWLALIPLAILGIVIGLWVKAEAVGGVTTLVLLLLAMLGGLWLPDGDDAAGGAGTRAGPAVVLAGRARSLADAAGHRVPLGGVLVLLAWARRTYRAGSPGFSTRHGQQQAVRSRHRRGGSGPMPGGGTPARRSGWTIFRPGYDGACDDPTTAPARHYGPDAAAPFTLRRAAQNKVWIYAFGLVFLLFAIAGHPGGRPVAGRADLADPARGALARRLPGHGLGRRLLAADPLALHRRLRRAAAGELPDAGAGRWSATGRTWRS